ncbi:hypothetical protein MDA_GLEAN10001578 [Myotis davidii]|uniref:Uncharacterized protein n=1 Tax=Myotis davidii TaxID=225400 RepID=L5LTJ1_MYODS|nr:hypothetical protein MDA_GLEAN10001578 [Myotis davidii]
MASEQQDTETSRTPVTDLTPPQAPLPHSPGFRFIQLYSLLHSKPKNNNLQTLHRAKLRPHTIHGINMSIDPGPRRRCNLNFSPNVRRSPSNSFSSNFTFSFNPTFNPIPVQRPILTLPPTYAANPGPFLSLTPDSSST